MNEISLNEKKQPSNPATNQKLSIETLFTHIRDAIQQNRKHDKYIANCMKTLLADKKL